MKSILITLPVESEEKQEFLEAASGGRENWELIFMNDEILEDDVLSSADVIIGMVKPERLVACRNLSWLQLGWAGAEMYTSEGILPDDCILSCASGAYGTAVAEHMAALTLALSCKLQQYLRQQTEHHWELLGRDGVISGSTVLVYGMGDIGGHYARLMKGMNCRVLGISRSRKEKRPEFDEQYIVDEAEKVIGQADIIALALPGGNETKHIFGERQIALAKNSALLINAGRGSTVETEALVRALSEGRLGGAALDVLEEEPPGDTPLWDMENVIITPHAAGKLEDPFNRKQVIRLCINNLYRFTHGMLPEHVVERNKPYS